MSHEPERDAAAYVSGAMRERRARRFERHLLTCDDCWTEVREGRLGRRLAEADRVLAPQALRERVRATIAAAEPPKTRTVLPARAPRPPLARRRSAWPAIAVTAALIAGAISLVTMSGSGEEQPGQITAALSDFQTHRITADVGHVIDDDAPDLSTLDLRLAYAGAGMLDGQAVSSFWYTDERDRQVLVYVSNERFPLARGAWWNHEGGPWRARIGDVEIVCSDSPRPMLALSQDADLLERIAAELNLAG